VPKKVMPVFHHANSVLSLARWSLAVLFVLPTGASEQAAARAGAMQQADGGNRERAHNLREALKLQKDERQLKYSRADKGGAATRMSSKWFNDQCRKHAESRVMHQQRNSVIC
jgi:hypothetical protein